MGIEDILDTKYLLWWLPPVVIYLLEHNGYIKEQVMSGFLFYCMWYYMFLLLFKYVADMGRAESPQFVAKNFSMPISFQDYDEIDDMRIRTDWVDMPVLGRWKIGSKTAIYPITSILDVRPNECVRGVFRKIDVRRVPYKYRSYLIARNYNIDNVWMFRYWLKGHDGDVDPMEDSSRVLAQIEEVFADYDLALNNAHDLLEGDKKVLETEFRRWKRIIPGEQRKGLLERVGGLLGGGSGDDESNK